MTQFKIGLIGSQRTLQGFEIAGVDLKDKTMFAFDESDDPVSIKDAFTYLCCRNDIGILFISENLQSVLTDEIKEHKNPLPSIKLIPTIY